MRNATLPTALLLAAMTLSLTSCSKNPVAPSGSLSGQPGATTLGGVQESDPPSEGSGGTPNSVSMPFVAGEEGRITAGRFTVWVRKNSIQQPATITVSVTDPEAMEAQIVVTPATANNFQSPVIVTANLSDVPNVDYSTMWMWYWDGAWEESLDVSAHPNQQNVVAHYNTLSACQVAPRNTTKGNKMSE